MHKLFIIFSVLLNSVSANYVNVERIECYSNIGEKIQFSFDFDSDYINSHELNVTFEIYDGNEVNLINYNNSRIFLFIFYQFFVIKITSIFLFL